MICVIVPSRDSATIECEDDVRWSNRDLESTLPHAKGPVPAICTLMKVIGLL
jgi:hypothetical protein